MADERDIRMEPGPGATEFDKRVAAAVALAGLLGAVAWWRRRGLAAGVRVAWDSAKATALAASTSGVLNPRVIPYIPWVIEAASAEGVGVFELLALGQGESGWGEYLDPVGPEGVGDKASRGGEDPPAYGLGGRRGWGYGLLQIDFRSFPDFVKSGKWRDPRANIRKGAAVLAGKRRYLASTPKTPTVTLSEAQASRRGVRPGTYRDPRPLRGAALTRSALAAYNTGEGNVLKSVAAGVDPDVTTANGAYAKNALARADSVAKRFLSSGVAG